MGILGILTGLSDASIEDFTVKAFIWSTLIVVIMTIVSYEFIIMPTPKRAFLQALLFMITGLIGLLSIHHLAWLMVSVLLGRTLYPSLWLAPNLYVDLYFYTELMVILLSIYLAYLVYINLCSED
jgi:hypothetical protein